MTVDIYIREKNGDREIRIPLLPEEFSFSSGDTMFITSNIMYNGEVSIPSGTELSNYSWKSEFPGILRKNDAMLRGTWTEPKVYAAILKDWQRNGTMLNLLITGYPVNVDVYIKTFSPRGTGAFGDIAYDITFIEARSIIINTTNVDESDIPKRYVAKPNTIRICYSDSIDMVDDLSTIAERYYGDSSRYIDIYNANKDIIEKQARAAGFASSENGHWLCGEMVLVLP